MQSPQLFAAPTYMDAFSRLGDRLAVETQEAVVRLCDDPRHPGLNTEALFAGRTPGMYSARVNIQYRLIFARRDDDVPVLLWVDNHDEAYQWADRRRADVAALMKRANGMRLAGVGRPAAIPRAAPDDPVPVASPDVLAEMAARGFEAYFAALDERQSALVTLDMSGWGGLCFVKGGAGTGKSSIAIRRAIHLAGTLDADAGPVLYLCFNRVLMEAVRQAIDSLAPPEVARAVEVTSFHSWAARYARSRGVAIGVDAGKELSAAVADARADLPAERQREIADLSDADVTAEIRGVLRPNQFETIEAYLDVTRPRSQGLPPLRRPQREAIWALDQRVRPDAGGPYQWDDVIERARALLADAADPPRYCAVIVDEAQDCSPVMARLARGLVGGAENTLMVFADAAQSIYANGFTWAQRELRPPGSRVRILGVPYRSTRQIHALAHSLYRGVEEISRELADLGEGGRDGPVPVLAECRDADEELDFVIDAIRRELADGRQAWEIGVVTDRVSRRDKVRERLAEAGIPAQALERAAPDGASASVATLHSAKGLDFASVYVLDVSPWDDSIDAQRAQLYVALTRSSHALTIVCRPGTRSALLDDLDPACYEASGLLAEGAA